MNRRLKRTLLYLADVLLAVYLVIAVTSWNNPKRNDSLCTQVNINISDSNNAGFLSAEEIRNMLKKHRLYPIGKKMTDINPRDIETDLTNPDQTPFVKTAECYKTEGGEVNITITQKMPVIRIKSDNGDDYYVDDNGAPLPNSNYTSDLIIATGNIDRNFARYYLTPLAKEIAKSPFWTNQIEQINVLPDHGIEIVPRVGNHIVFLGYMPVTIYRNARNQGIANFAKRKLSRLEKFYRYGLSQAGWNKYSYINMEFDNQIICKKRKQ